MEYLNKLFSVKEENLKQMFSLKINHNPSDGKFKEELVKAVLDIIPQRYKVTNGFIIDSHGKMSKEMDIIIYDDVYVPRFFVSSYSVIPIESVVAVCQVKTTLSKTELINSIDNLNSIDYLTPEKNGQIISATSGTIREKRYILPLKILFCGMSKTKIDKDSCKAIDIVFSLTSSSDNLGKIQIKQLDDDNLVSTSLDIIEMKTKKMENNNVVVYSKEKLYHFYFSVLRYLTLINNSMIINYQKYYKEGKENE